MKAKQINELIAAGMFGYGFTMTRKDLLALEDHTEPDYHAMEGFQAVKEANRYNLIVLGLYGSINEQLLSLGRTFKQVDGDYIVPGINETMKYVKLYDDKASRNLLRSKKLFKSFQKINPGVVQTHQEKLAMDKAHRLAANQQNENGLPGV